MFPGRYAYPFQRQSSNPYAHHEYRNKSRTKNVTVARVSTSISVSQIFQHSKNSLRVSLSFVLPDDDSAIAVFSSNIETNEKLRHCEMLRTPTISSFKNSLYTFQLCILCNDDSLIPIHRCSIETSEKHTTIQQGNVS